MTMLQGHGLLPSILLLVLLSMPTSAQARSGEAPLVAAASDLQFALPEIATAFEQETGKPVRLSFGSSGNFARQIRQGAPFSLFLSADEAYVFDLEAAGLTRGDGVLYARGRLVMIAPPGSPLAEDPGLDALETALASTAIRRFAIANPDHAPYGQRAREALERRGLWQQMAPLLIYGENVTQAARFATSRDADGGIIAYSLALAPAVAARGRYALLPEAWHAPLNQRMVLLEGAGDIAEAFYRYMQAPAARKILARYGFELPADVP